jgi:hypothetical protein
MYATLAYLNGEDLGYVADQLGHEDPTFTMRCYRQATRTRADRLPQAHRKEYDRALEWARIGGAYRALPGTRDTETASVASVGQQKTPPERGFPRERMMGLEPTTFCMASRRSSQLSYIRVGGAF